MSLLARLFAFNQSGGQEVNATRNKTLTERLLDGQVDISVAAGHVTLTTTPYDTAQVNYRTIRLTGAPGAARNVLLPEDATGIRIFINDTTGGQTITVKTAAGGSVGVDLPVGVPVSLYSDGTDCIAVGIPELSAHIAAAAPHTGHAITPVITDFASSGTIDIPATAKTVTIISTGAGGAGGGGRQGAAGTARFGGGGGTAGARVDAKYNVADLPSLTLNITVGAGGIPGVGAAGADTNGGNGGNGGSTTVTSGGFNLLFASGGFGGSGGTAASGAAGALPSFPLFAPSAAGAGATGNASNVTHSANAAGSGAGGGGISTGNVEGNGGNGGVGTWNLVVLSANAGGVAPGGNGTDAPALAAYHQHGFGGGGGGGAGNNSGVGGAGGDGRRGGGGGGGGAALNGNNGGDGGAGGDGWVRVIYE